MKAYITELEVEGDMVIFYAYADVLEWKKKKFKKGQRIEIR